MSNPSFSNLHAAMQAQVDQQFLPCVSTALFKGRDVVDTFCTGFANKEDGEALREDAADALTLDLADAALAAWDCIAELPATQARAEVVQGIDAAITALLGDTERVRGRKRHNVRAKARP